MSIFSSLLKKRSRVSREIFNELNFKMELIQGKFQCALLTFVSMQLFFVVTQFALWLRDSVKWTCKKKNV